MKPIFLLALSSTRVICILNGSFGSGALNGKMLLFVGVIENSKYKADFRLYKVK